MGGYRHLADFTKSLNSNLPVTKYEGREINPLIVCNVSPDVVTGMDGPKEIPTELFRGYLNARLKIKQLKLQSTQSHNCYNV